MKVHLYSLVLSWLLSSCSTLFNSGSQSISVVSSDGSEIPVVVTTPSGSYKTKLPATIVAEPSTFSNVMVEVEDKCYDRSSQTIPKGITPSYWANILNIYGFLIDPLTGAMWKYDNQASITVNRKHDCNREVAH